MAPQVARETQTSNKVYRTHVWQEKQQVISSSSLNRMRNTGFLTDVVIVCDGKEFRVHRIVLCSATPYFEAMFQAEMTEAQTGKIEFNDITPNCMEHILDFIYSQTVPKVRNLDIKRLRGLLHATDLIQLSTLFKYVLQSCTETLRVESFLQLWEIADLYDNAEMLNRIQLFLVRNFNSVIAGGEFPQLSVTQLKELLGDPDLQGHSDLLVESVIIWIKFNVDERQRELESLLSLVDLKNLSRSYMAKLIEEPVIISNQPVFNILARQGIANFNKFAPYCFLLCFGVSPTGNVLNIFDVERDKWLPQKNGPQELTRGMAVVEHGGRLFMIGGGSKEANNYIPQRAVYKYSPVQNSVEEIGNLTHAVYQPGAGVLHNFIYVVCGIAFGGVDTRRTQRINPVDGSCVQLAPTNHPHIKPYVFSFIDCVYAVGRRDDHDSSLERYNIASNQWCIITNVPSPVSWCSAAVCNNKLFVVRKKDEAKFYLYDFVSGNWESKDFNDDSPSSVCDIVSMDVIGEVKEQVLFVFSRKKYSHQYDLKTGAWKKSPKLRKKMWCVNTNVIYSKEIGFFGGV